MHLRKAEVFRMALAERHRMAETLETLTPIQWERQTLCEQWLVRDLAGHVAACALDNVATYLFSMAVNGFDLDQQNLHRAARWAGRGDDRILQALRSDRATLVLRSAPYLLLVDHVVHHQDIRRPLRLGTDIPEPHLRATLHFVTTKSAFGKDLERVQGRRLVATDMDWTYGEGSELIGPAEALLMYVMGRRQAYVDLTDHADD